MKTRQSGFAHIGILLLVIIVAAAGFTGWWVWHNHKSTKKSTSTATANSSQAASSSTLPAISPAGWKSYTTTYEKFSFKYPTDWTLKSTPAPHTASENACASPGTDQVVLTAPDGSQVQLTGGINCIGGGGNITVNSSSTIQLLGGQYHLIIGDFHTTTLAKKTSNKACISTSATQDESESLPAKNVTDPTHSATPRNIFCYTTPHFASDTGGYYSTTDFNNLMSFRQAKSIFASLSY